MASIQTSIVLNDQFTDVIYGIYDAIGVATSGMQDFQQCMDADLDTGAFVDAREDIEQMGVALAEMQPEILENANRQQEFNQKIQEGAEYADNLSGMISKAVTAFASIATVKKVASFISDSLDAYDTQLNAETQLMSVLANMLDADYVAEYAVEVGVDADTSGAIDEINAISDSVDTVEISVDMQTAALQAEFDAITEKASEIQASGIYGDEAMIAGAAELATYFTDTDAITMMMDTLADYAMGMSGGGEIDSSAMVEYATNLGKIMSGSYDAMTKKGFEFTDAQEAIIEGTATEAQIVETLGEEYLDMSADMQAAAAITQVIDESWAGLYETMSDTPEGKIIQMTNAWGDMKEVIASELYPYVLLFVDAVNENWDTIQSVVNGFTSAVQVVMGILASLLDMLFNVASVITENWSWISPIIYGVAAALLVYAGYLAITNAAEIASTAVKTAMCVAELAHAAATGTAVTATQAETAAQLGLNAAFLSSPITWVVLMIVALIAAIYAAVAAVNHFAGTSVSATGIIAGVFSVLGAHVLNTFVVPLWNGFASLANFFGNVFNNPVAAVEVLFYDMCLTIIGYIQNLASAIETLINKIPGVTVDITSGLDSFYSQLETAQQAVKDESGWTEYVSKMDYVDYSDAWDAGYSFGEGVEDTISSLSLSDLFGTTDLTGIEASSYTSALTDALANSGVGDSLDSISGDTSDISDSLDITQEDMKYMRDLAEQEAINRYTTAEINIDQTNNNTVTGGMDLDGVVSGLTDAVNEAVDIMTEGVHD